MCYIISLNIYTLLILIEHLVGVAPGAASSVVGKVSHIVAAATLSQIIPITDVDLYG